MQMPWPRLTLAQCARASEGEGYRLRSSTTGSSGSSSDAVRLTLGLSRTSDATSESGELTDAAGSSSACDRGEQRSLSSPDDSPSSEVTAKALRHQHAVQDSESGRWDGGAVRGGCSGPPRGALVDAEVGQVSGIALCADVGRLHARGVCGGAAAWTPAAARQAGVKGRARGGRRHRGVLGLTRTRSGFTSTGRWPMLSPKAVQLYRVTTRALRWPMADVVAKG
eukprot:5517669-Prymnesium_polylepis.1